MKKGCLFFLFFCSHLAFGYNREQALGDLSFIQKIVTENHPGAVNDTDPFFNPTRIQKEEEIREDILDLKEDTTELRSKITEFCRSFNDAHVRVAWKQPVILPEKGEKVFSEEQNSFEAKMGDQSAYFRIPTFYITPNNEEHIKKIISMMPEAANRKQIIFDLRGNGGGNSLWGTKILESLFGNEYVQFRIKETNKNCYTEWRASERNYLHLKTILLQTKKTEETKEFCEFLDRIVSGLKKSIDDGNSLYKEEPNNTSFQEPIEPVQNHHVASEIVILIDRQCFSSCLTFIDQIKAMNHTSITLLGEKTGADSIYMDICRVSLPSQEGFFVYPMKVYRNRIRGHNEAYIPDRAMSPDQIKLYLSQFKF